MSSKIKWFLLIIVLFILATGFGYMYGKSKRVTINYYHREPELVQQEDKDTKMTLVAIGDALIHNSIYNDASLDDGNYDFHPMLEKIKQKVQSYDLKYYNQETILGGKELGLSSYPRFNSPYEVGDAFIDAGFNLVSLATNHTMDKGEIGVFNSINYWKNKEVITAGSYTSFKERDYKRIYEKNGIKYAFLSYSTSTNGLTPPSGKEYLVNVYSNELAKNDIERVKQEADVIIVAMHWGVEYSTNVSSQQREIATYLSSLGVHIILGAHPHVIEPIEFINDTLVIYSLGNAISDQVGTDRLTGLMASCTIHKRIENQEVKITIEDVKAEFLYTYSTYQNKRNFVVCPYGELNDSILPGYRNYDEKYKNIVTSLSDKIEVVSLD